MGHHSMVCAQNARLRGLGECVDSRQRPRCNLWEMVWGFFAVILDLSSFLTISLSIRLLRTFQMSQPFASGGQSIGVSASTSVLPMNTQDWSPLGWTCWISLQSKGLSRVFSSTTVQTHQWLPTKATFILRLEGWLEVCRWKETKENILGPPFWISVGLS